MPLRNPPVWNQGLVGRICSENSPAFYRWECCASDMNDWYKTRVKANNVLSKNLLDILRL